MWKIKSPYRDAQEASPIAYCETCGGEIYEADEVVFFPGGVMLHIECATPEDREDPACIVGEALNCLS